MIDLNKSYKTVSGFHVILLGIIDYEYAENPHRVFGIYKNKDKWLTGTWSIRGEYVANIEGIQPLSLVETNETDIDLTGVTLK